MSRRGIILQTSDLSKHFGGVHALEGFDLSVKVSQIHGLIGPNGSGKTTFFNLVTGLLPVTIGNIYFYSTDITDTKAHIRAKMGISRTFQAGKLAPNMTTLENVMTGAHTVTHQDIMGTILRRPGASSAQETKMQRQALELLSLVGLESSANKWAKELVWVERQLVQIARALASSRCFSAFT